MAPAEELARELLRDRVAEDGASEKALASRASSRHRRPRSREGGRRGHPRMPSSPLVAIARTIPGRASAPTSLLRYSLSASAPHCARSRRSSRRFRKIPRSRRGIVRTTCRCGTGSSTSSRNHSDHRSCFFFSHDGQNDLPRQENERARSLVPQNLTYAPRLYCLRSRWTAPPLYSASRSVRHCPSTASSLGRWRSLGPESSESSSLGTQILRSDGQRPSG